MVRRLGVVMVIIVVMVVKFSSCPVLGMSGSLLSGFGEGELNQVPIPLYIFMEKVLLS